jgi:hypothetical protein
MKGLVWKADDGGVYVPNDSDEISYFHPLYARLALEVLIDMTRQLRQRVGPIVSCVKANTKHSPPSDRLPPTEGGRRQMVDAFLQAASRVADRKIIKTDIWRAAHHTTPRQFQYWQSGSKRATEANDMAFSRILAMNPSEFVELLNERERAERERAQRTHR